MSITLTSKFSKKTNPVIVKAFEEFKKENQQPRYLLSIVSLISEDIKKLLDEED